MLKAYEGQATLVGAGHEVPITVTFYADTHSPLRSWEGNATANSEHWTLDLLGTATLRMPDGRTGQCVVTDAREAGGIVALTIVGSRRPPFGEWD